MCFVSGEQLALDASNSCNQLETDKARKTKTQGRQMKTYLPSIELADSGGGRWQTQANVIKLCQRNRRAEFDSGLVQ